MRGVQALKSGLIWRVGDGSEIDIWKDPWIPITPRGGTILNRVADLENGTKN